MVYVQKESRLFAVGSQVVGDLVEKHD